MKTKLRTFALAGAAVLTVAGLARAEDAKVTGELDLPVLSAYVWRGQVVNDKPVLEPSLTVSKNGFSLNTWANFNLNNSYASYAQDNKKEFSEVDLTASYATTVGSTNSPIALGGGFVQYLFPNQTLTSGTGSNAVSKAYPGTHEVYASIGLPSVFLAPTLQVNYDFDSANGAYANFGISQGFELVKDKASLVASASIGAATSKYNEYYFGTKKNAFNDAVVGLALPITLPGGWSIKPMLQYVFLPDSTIRDDADTLYGHKDRFVGSLTAVYAF